MIVTNPMIIAKGLSDLAIQKYQKRGFIAILQIQTTKADLNGRGCYINKTCYVGDRQCWTVKLTPTLQGDSSKNQLGSIEDNSWLMGYMPIGLAIEYGIYATLNGDFSHTYAPLKQVPIEVERLRERRRHKQLIGNLGKTGTRISHGNLVNISHFAYGMINEVQELNARKRRYPFIQRSE
jgi:hypothetical protein